MSQVRPDRHSRHLIAMCLPALNAVTPVVLTRVDTALMRAGRDAQRADVQIALAEALNNIAEHAYRDRPLGSFAIRVLLGRREVQIVLQDWGAAMPGAVVPEGVAPSPAKFSEGGYGWYLIRSVMSDVCYKRLPDSNLLTLTHRL